MAKEKNPSIEQFKNFVKKHPKLIQKVKNGEGSWQELFEEWYLLGEDDPKWKKYRINGTFEKSKLENEQEQIKEAKNVLIDQLLLYIKNMDMKQLQNYLGQMSEAIESLQNLLGQLKNNGEKEEMNRTLPVSDRRNPFLFRKD
ncbi:YlbD family protein [Bacillus andreraoultii]|uniref:YlbD family protein n=1 Tax=Bacillus andreraoultii TaxID=1499685 RepID=UPI0005397342|nr:YlbD family protein [Bacillus andreraoultii]